jgi:predicted lipid-binding transport protein (Tim44 family)
MGFLLKFLVITFGLLYLIGFAARWWMRKLYKNFQQQAGVNQPKPKQEGEIIIEKVPQRNKGNKEFKGGEYVDYEELKP